MLIVMRREATAEDVEAVVAAIAALGFEARPLPGHGRTAIGVLGNDGPIDPARFTHLEGILEVVPVSEPYKQVSREWKREPTRVPLGAVWIGGGEEAGIIAGPCAVESRSQIVEVAHALREAGAIALRGGAFKPRTSPYSFQGLGEKGLELLAEARARTGLPIVTEALEPSGVERVAEVADVIQVGARNMQNAPLLRKAGQSGVPVLIKRGPAATVTELLLAAEYVLAEGNPHVILCERGVRGFDSATRNMFDVSAIPLVHQRSHLPILGDPSHATGASALVPAVALAALAAGADGLLIEVHPEPARALSDGAQSLDPEAFARLLRKARALLEALGRELSTLPEGVPA
ncbi:MAG: 3-deoxy-7-phosphoheptulonate synthase [Gemmatimonadota bacterium]